MTYPRIFSQSNKNCVSSGTGTTYSILSEYFSLLPVFSEVRVAQFSVVFCQLLFVFFVFLVIVLSVRRMAASDNPFGIFKLFSSNSNLFSTCYNWNVAWNNIQVLL